jgi:UDP-2,3-diacylglucosamine pyrophosphatase LpxH
MNYKNLCHKLIQLIRKKRQEKEEIMQDIVRIWRIARKERNLFQEIIDELRERQEEYHEIREK